MIKKIILSICLFISAIAQAQELTKFMVISMTNAMLMSDKYEIEIIKITEPVNQIRAVLLKMPYREFPNILFFKFDLKKGNWVRVFEGLNPGIQDNPSGLLDWHTKGVGIDFQVNKQKTYKFNTKAVNSLMDAMVKQNGILIPYQHFLHFQIPDSGYNKQVDPYTIDKTNYYDLANLLTNKKYKNYPQKECVMFDSPQTMDIQFSYSNNTYKIRAVTYNSQIWIYQFSDIDAENRFLLNKQIQAVNGF